MPELLLVAAVVLAVNLLPAFGPPTWAVLVGLGVSLDVLGAPLVAVGALSAATGRYLLAHGARRLRSRFSYERLASLEALRGRLLDRPAGAVAGLALFALSPVPSAQLFVGAGLTGVRILPLTLAFFAGRVVSYAGYVGGAAAAEAAARRALGDALTSPWAIALQVLLLAGLVALVRIDWTKRLGRSARRRGGPPPAQTPHSSTGGLRGPAEVRGPVRT